MANVRVCVSVCVIMVAKYLLSLQLLCVDGIFLLLYRTFGEDGCRRWLCRRRRRKKEGENLLLH